MPPHDVLPVFTLSTVPSHVHKHHEAPAESPHQKHGDVHAVDNQIVEYAEIQAPVSQKEQDDWELVLQPEEDAHADVLQEEEGWEEHPKQGCQQTAAKVQEEAQEAVHTPGAQVKVKVVVLGAHQLGGVSRAAGRVHAGGVGAMEAAHPAWDGDHRHGGATKAQYGTQEWQAGYTASTPSKLVLVKELRNARWNFQISFLVCNRTMKQTVFIHSKQKLFFFSTRRLEGWITFWRGERNTPQKTSSLVFFPHCVLICFCLCV